MSDFGNALLGVAAGIDVLANVLNPGSRTLEQQYGSFWELEQAARQSKIEYLQQLQNWPFPSEQRPPK